MNDYLTPRRRHSSLFQRMQDEINKISRKLSAAKQHKVSHASNTNDGFQRQQNESPGLTVRRVKENLPETNSKELTRKLTGLADRTNNFESRPRQPIRKLKFSHAKIEDLEDIYEPEDKHEMRKLMQENRQLQEQLGKMKAICEQQSFKLGYMRAQSHEVASQLESARFDSYRQNLYLTKLLQGYKIKVNKYKQILNDQESLQIDIRDL